MSVIRKAMEDAEVSYDGVGHAWAGRTVICGRGSMIEPTCRLLHSIEKDGQTPELRTLILQKEVAAIGYRLVRKHRTPQDAPLYMADIGLEIGHAMVQLEMLALDLGLVPEDCHKLGLQSTWERFKDFWPEDL
jgi:hypothetical protein